MNGERLQFTRVLALLWFLTAVFAVSCNRHDVGSEKNNPAPSSNMTLAEAQVRGLRWALEDPVRRRYGTPSPTSSMTPLMDSRSVLLLELVETPVQLHDILVINEGPGRENVCHMVQDVKDGHVYMDGHNNTWPDGWIPMSAIKWRVAAVIYSRG